MLLLIFIALVFVSCGNCTYDNDSDWLEYKRKYNKVYNEDEEPIRYAIWKKNDEDIVMHNARFDATYTQGHNQYSDLTDEEFKSEIQGNCLLQVAEKQENVTYEYSGFQNNGAPDTVDWVEKGYVTGVKNQGSCGSCYSFGATGSLEGAWYKKTGKLIALSEQQIIDCSLKNGNHGCEGGLVTRCFKHIKQVGGIESEVDYPYEAKFVKCRLNKSKTVAKVNGFKSLPEKDENALKNALANVGPVAVAINSGRPSFRWYKKGVYYDTLCSQYGLDHAVLAVGYGREGNMDYFLVKNSWGPKWGLKGYIKMARNRGNHCGIASRCSFPTV